MELFNNGEDGAPTEYLSSPKTCFQELVKLNIVVDKTDPMVTTKHPRPF